MWKEPRILTIVPIHYEIKFLPLQVTEHKANINIDKLKQILEETEKKITEDMTQLLSQMKVYIPNPATQAILYRPIRDQVMESLTQFSNLVTTQYTEEDRTIIQLQTIDRISKILGEDRES